MTETLKYGNLTVAKELDEFLKSEVFLPLTTNKIVKTAIAKAASINRNLDIFIK